jgi:hypothetical protein
MDEFILMCESLPEGPANVVVSPQCLLSGEAFGIVKGYDDLRLFLQSLRKHRVLVIMGGEDVGRFARGDDSGCLFCVWKCGSGTVVDFDELRRTFDGL